MSGYDDREFDRGDRTDGRDPGEVVRYAFARVRGPAILLMVVAVLTLVHATLIGINSLDVDARFDVARKRVDENPKLNAQQKQQARDMLDQWEPGVKVGMPVAAGLFGVCAVLMLVGGLKMMNLSGPGWARLGGIAALTPLTTGLCCLAGLPVGIWVLVVLANPDVKAGFAAARAAAAGPDGYGP